MPRTLLLPLCLVAACPALAQAPAAPSLESAEQRIQRLLQEQARQRIEEQARDRISTQLAEQIRSRYPKTEGKAQERRKTAADGGVRIYQLFVREETVDDEESDGGVNHYLDAGIKREAAPQLTPTRRIVASGALLYRAAGYGGKVYSVEESNAMTETLSALDAAAAAEFRALWPWMLNACGARSIAELVAKAPRLESNKSGPPGAMRCDWRQGEESGSVTFSFTIRAIPFWRWTLEEMRITWTKQQQQHVAKEPGEPKTSRLSRREYTTDAQGQVKTASGKNEDSTTILKPVNRYHQGRFESLLRSFLP